MVLKSVGILSCGKVMGAIYALMGLIFGSIFAIMSVLGVAVNQQGNAQDMVLPIVFGAGSVIVLPIMYGIGGFIGGVIMAALYNFIASIIGGLELEFESNVTRPAQNYSESMRQPI